MPRCKPPRVDLVALVEALIDREGHYVNHPAHRGGATCWGIAEAVARAAGYTGEMRDLPRETAASIYRDVYWQSPGFDRVALRAPLVAAELFDIAAHMGTAVAASLLQRSLNALNCGARDYPDIAVDCMIGPRSLFALDGLLGRRGAAGETVLLRAIDALKGERYIAFAERRPSQEIFLYGWLANHLARG
ncbi:glycoside hydrolase family 108 protein [Sphingopyxis flava]|uniref:Predicted Peptidoglycan domain-containing protein n=1 Tax=Sphingopyxis flava TaxID=1507287 RepID=A0A1T4ZU18_9SPHN|nr:glycosyl hydrolase 108 family protein [Sphingopyxis flava]SKB26251.1 Predicted Peptidoglycan domain-containing protein [Sphingopyxis flava]